MRLLGLRQAAWRARAASGLSRGPACASPRSGGPSRRTGARPCREPRFRHGTDARLLDRALPFAPGPGAAGGGGQPRHLLSDAVQDRVHAPPPGHHVDLSGDGRQQVAPRPKVAIAVLSVRCAVALRLQPQQALADPQQTRRSASPPSSRRSIQASASSSWAIRRPCASVIRAAPRQEPLVDAETPLGHSISTATSARRPHGLQRLDVCAAAAVAFKEQRVQRIEKGGFAEFVRFGQNRDAVAQVGQHRPAPGKAAAKVGQSRSRAASCLHLLRKLYRRDSAAAEMSRWPATAGGRSCPQQRVGGVAQRARGGSIRSSRRAGPRPAERTSRRRTSRNRRSALQGRVQRRTVRQGSLPPAVTLTE